MSETLFTKTHLCLVSSRGVIFRRLHAIIANDAAKTSPERFGNAVAALHLTASWQRGAEEVALFAGAVPKRVYRRISPIGRIIRGIRGIGEYVDPEAREIFSHWWQGLDSRAEEFIQRNRIQKRPLQFIKGRARQDVRASLEALHADHVLGAEAIAHVRSFLNLAVPGFMKLGAEMQAEILQGRNLFPYVKPTVNRSRIDPAIRLHLKFSPR